MSASKHQVVREFKEMIKDIQEILLTAGVHSNIFRNGEYQVQIVVNDKVEAQRALEYLMENEDYVERVAIERMVYTKQTYPRGRSN